MNRRISWRKTSAVLGLSGLVSFAAWTSAFQPHAENGSQRCGASEIPVQSSDRAGQTQLPLSTYLSKPGMSFFSRQVFTNEYVVGPMLSPNRLQPLARIKLEPNSRQLTLQLANADCIHTSKPNAHLGILALEHLYGIVLSSGVDAIFRLESCDDQRVCGKSSSNTHSQYEMLREIARLRQELVAAQRDADRYKRWVSLGIDSARSDGTSAAAQIKAKSGAAAGQLVAFAVAPHMGCFAKTNTQGLAECELEDYHGAHEHAHEESKDARMTVTITGSVDGSTVVAPIAKTFTSQWVRNH